MNRTPLVWLTALAFAGCVPPDAGSSALMPGMGGSTPNAPTGAGDDPPDPPADAPADDGFLAADDLRGYVQTPLGLALSGVQVLQGGLVVATTDGDGRFGLPDVGIPLCRFMRPERSEEG